MQYTNLQCPAQAPLYILVFISIYILYKAVGSSLSFQLGCSPDFTGYHTIRQCYCFCSKVPHEINPL